MRRTGTSATIATQTHGVSHNISNYVTHFFDVEFDVVQVATSLAALLLLMEIC
jgi:hypothetical protein